MRQQRKKLKFDEDSVNGLLQEIYNESHNIKAKITRLFTKWEIKVKENSEVAAIGDQIVKLIAARLSLPFVSRLEKNSAIKSPARRWCGITPATGASGKAIFFFIKGSMAFSLNPYIDEAYFFYHTHGRCRDIESLEFRDDSDGVPVDGEVALALLLDRILTAPPPAPVKVSISLPGDLIDDRACLRLPQ